MLRNYEWSFDVKNAYIILVILLSNNLNKKKTSLTIGRFFIAKIVSLNSVIYVYIELKIHKLNFRFQEVTVSNAVNGPKSSIRRIADDFELNGLDFMGVR